MSILSSAEYYNLRLSKHFSLRYLAEVIVSLVKGIENIFEIGTKLEY
jgi:hypothetical protein